MKWPLGSSRPRHYLGLGVVAGLVAIVSHLIGGQHKRPGLNYLAGLQAKGEKISFEALVRGRPRGTDVVRILITNTAALLTNSIIEPASLDFTTNSSPGRVIVVWRQPNPKGIHVGGREITWEELNREVEQKQPLLGAIEEALKKGPAEWDIGTNTISSPRLNFAAIRRVVQWFGLSVLSELQQGQNERALEKLEAIAALAGANRSCWTLVGEMVRIALCNYGLSATWQALQSEGWSDAQMERMQRAWEPFNLTKAVEEGLVGCRVWMSEAWDIAHREKSLSAFEAKASHMGIVNPALPGAFGHQVANLRRNVLFDCYKLLYMDADELFTYQAMQEGIDCFRFVNNGDPLVLQNYLVSRTCGWNRVREAFLSCDTGLFSLL